MQALGAAELLMVWERGSGQGRALRALLLLTAAVPAVDLAQLARFSIGRRDAHLLALRETLFGQALRCMARCAGCGQAIELAFQTRDIRQPHAGDEPAQSFAFEGHTLSFRLPDSSDLLAIEGQADAAAAAAALIARCVLQARGADGELAPHALPASVVDALSRRMAELDPQAEVVFDTECPACGRSAHVAFDIASHLWTELEGWARSMLAQVHALARAYGWSERAILELSPPRRRAYLALLGVA